ncbi:MAG: DUF1566 domain-containing protein [Bacteroidota bacterium]
MKYLVTIGLLVGLFPIAIPSQQVDTAFSSNSYTQAVGKYKIVDTNQKSYFNDRKVISKPNESNPLIGQDAHYEGNVPSYTIISKEIVKDDHTELMWQRDYEVISYSEALKKLRSFKSGGYDDWRLPTIKEAYSLIQFDGIDVSGPRWMEQGESQPFIDGSVFEFQYAANGQRMIDHQMLSATIYKGKTMGRAETVFGVNFADGRIKGYPIQDPRRGEKQFVVRFVRGNKDYGKNNLVDNQDHTVSDLATDLMWSQNDSGKGMNWLKALEWVQQKNKEAYLGYTDWRLPNAKELQSIVDYNIAPQTHGEAAISPLFNTTKITVEEGRKNYPFFWSSTTHQTVRGGDNAVYVCFGDAYGYFSPPHARNDSKTLLDVHGAGAQRSDPKVSHPAKQTKSRGGQGDVIRIDNFVRLVRNI